MNHYWAPNRASIMGCVYRAYDKDGTLLYVGTTQDFDTRCADHMSDAIWRNQVARWRVRWHLNWYDAWDAEREAIRTEHPRWNIRSRSVNHPEGFAKTLLEVAAKHPDNLVRPSRKTAAQRLDHLAHFFGESA